LFVRLVEDDQRFGVVRSALSEAAGGFAALQFPASERKAAQKLLERFSEKEIVLGEDDLRLARVILEFALKELGPEEFQTITGYDFKVGEETLRELR
jgi:hypothetical protein